MEDMENKDLELESVQPEVEQEKEPDVDPIEAQALAQGWKAGGVKSAAEFLRAGPLYEEIERRGRKIDNLEKKLDALLEYQRKQEDIVRANVLRDLENNRLNAISRGDVRSVQEIEQKIVEHSPQQVELHNTPQAQDFIAKYKADIFSSKDRQEYVDRRYDELKKYNLSADEHFKQLEADYKNQFYKQPEAASFQTVESDSGQKQEKKSFGVSNLNREQKEILKMLETTGIMTKDEYIKSLIAQGELK